MPMYEYHCSKCGKTFEKLQKFSDAPLTEHPDCGGTVEKLISTSAFQLKGTGWYVTDYAKSGAKAEAAKAEASEKSGGKSESKSTDTKTSDGGEGKTSESKPQESQTSDPKSGESRSSESKSTEPGVGKAEKPAASTSKGH